MNIKFGNTGRIIFGIIGLALISLFACTSMPVAQPMQQPISTPSVLPQKTETVNPIINKTTHGWIRWNEIWRGEIHITGDIFVAQGYTLTIEPGTKVLIAANHDAENLMTDAFMMQKGICLSSDYIDKGVNRGEPFRDEGNHITVRILGTLHAVGTPDQMITITSDSQNPTIYDWNHFDFYHGILSYCVMEYYRVLDPGKGVTISHNILRNVGECAIGGTSSSPIIEYNKISYAGHELIDMHANSSHIIRNNLLGPNPNHNGVVIDSSSPTITDNTFVGCGTNIYVFGTGYSSPIITNNTFESCGTNIQYKTSSHNATMKDNTFVKCGESGIK